MGRFTNKVPKDPRGGHTRLYWEMQDSNAWRALSLCEQGLYFAIRRKLGATNNGNIEATLGAMRHAGVKSSATLSKGLRALMTTGFIAKTRQGGVAIGQKECCLYRFTDEPVFEHPKQGVEAMRATNDWKDHATVAAARAAVRKAHADAKRPSVDRDPGLQKLNRASSKTERKAAAVDSNSEVHAASLV